METPRTANLARNDEPARARDGDDGLDPLPILTGPLRCAAHPKVETYLRCGKCDKPICPRCMIQTPVGARCRQCAGLRRLPMFDVRPLDLVKGFLSAVAVSAAGGIALLYLLAMPGVGFFGFILMALLGYVVGEAASAAARRRRSRTLGWATVLALPIGLVLGRAAFQAMVMGWPVALAVPAAMVSLVAPIWSLLLLALAMWIAYQRVT